MEMPRLLPLSGIVFVVLALVAVIVFGGDTPGSNAPGGEVLAYYDAHQAREVIGAFVLAASVPFLVCFAVTAAMGLWPAEAGRRPVWEIVLIAGSALVSAALLVAAAVHFALADGATNDASADALQAVNLIDGNIWVAFNAGFGVMMLGAAGSLIPRGGAYRWLGWLALVVGVALFIPYADFIGLLLTLVWILVMSVMLFRARLLVTHGVAPTTA
jgi:hypothetical protein